MHAYEVACPDIFLPKWYHRLGFGRIPNLAKYDNAKLREYLEEWLGPELRLRDLDQKVIVTAFRVDGKQSTHEFVTLGQLHRVGDGGSGRGGVSGGGHGRWRPAVFSNLPTVQGVARSDNDLLAVDAALRSSAAPTFFPIYQGYCDGAMTANNPSLMAVSKALAHYPELRREDVRVLSIGAGSKLNGFEADALGSGNWGWWQWAPHAIQLLMDSSTLSTDLLAGLMLGRRKQYHRLECALETRIYYEETGKEGEEDEEQGSLVNVDEVGGKDKVSRPLQPPRRPAWQRPVNWAIDDVASMPDCVELAQGLDLKPTSRFIADMLENRCAAREQEQNQNLIWTGVEEQPQKLAASTVLEHVDGDDNHGNFNAQLIYDEEAGVRYSEQIETVDDAWELFSRDL